MKEEEIKKEAFKEGMIANLFFLSYKGTVDVDFICACGKVHDAGTTAVYEIPNYKGWYCREEFIKKIRELYFNKIPEIIKEWEKGKDG
jgi:hypothetical protein